MPGPYGHTKLAPKLPGRNEHEDELDVLGVSLQPGVVEVVQVVFDDLERRHSTPVWGPERIHLVPVPRLGVFA